MITLLQLLRLRLFDGLDRFSECCDERLRRGQGLFRQLEFRHQHTIFIHHDQTITLFHDDSFQREARSVSGDDRTERR